MSIRSCFLVANLLVVCAGCQSLGTESGLTMNTPLGDAHSRKGPGDEAADPWVEEAGTVTRAEHIPEPVDDPLGLRKYFVSERARSIERNLGVGD